MTNAIWKRGPTQLLTANVTSPRTFTVVPARRTRSNVFPASTVKELILMVVQATAAATSLRLEIEPVQRLPTGLAETDVTAK